MDPLPEPWLRGPIPGVHPLAAPVLYAFQQAREDLARCTEGLSSERLWRAPGGSGPVGFHIRHIARSTRRLFAYLEGRQLTGSELASLAEEKLPGATREELLQEMEAALGDAERTVRSLDPAALSEARVVGRKLLPTTVIGLLTHVAEHTQRHIGLAIAAARLARPPE